MARHKRGGCVVGDDSLAGPKATEVEAPDLDPSLKALDTVCGR